MKPRRNRNETKRRLAVIIGLDREHVKSNEALGTPSDDPSDGENRKAENRMTPLPETQKKKKKEKKEIAIKSGRRILTKFVVHHRS